MSRQIIETAGQCQTGGIKEKDIRRWREAIFVEIIEFDPGLQG